MIVEKQIKDNINNALWKKYADTGYVILRKGAQRN